jgi:hypothetical protein
VLNAELFGRFVTRGVRLLKEACGFGIKSDGTAWLTVGAENVYEGKLKAGAAGARAVKGRRKFKVNE